MGHFALIVRRRENVTVTLQAILQSHIYSVQSLGFCLNKALFSWLAFK